MAMEQRRRMLFEAAGSGGGVAEQAEALQASSSASARH